MKGFILVVGLCLLGSCSSSDSGKDATSDMAPDAKQSLCPDGTTQCSWNPVRCVNLQTDESNCGKCGVTCDEGAGKICSKGACTCVGDAIDCDGTCVDLSTDGANCGECGKVCGDGELCTNGSCGNGCTPPKKVCDGACLDVTVDDNNCGDCGVTCDSDKGEACTDGKCA